MSLDGLKPEFRERLQLLLLEAGKRCTLSYGYRSRAEQQRLYDGWMAGKPGFFPANRPGTSKHETGDAADVAHAHWDPATKQWFGALLAKYGFHAPYINEPWHLELARNRKPVPIPVTLQEASMIITNPAIKILPTMSGKGYYIVAQDGAVFSFGDAVFYGGRGGDDWEAAPMIDAALTPSGKGYWLLGADGGIFSFGDAEYFGNAQEHLTT